MFKFGIDVEFFVAKTVNGVGKYVPAYRIVEESKSEPGFAQRPNGLFQYHWDNVALEVASPVYRYGDNNINEAVQDVFQFAQTLLPVDHKLLTVGAMNMPAKWHLDPESSIFGCAPDWCPYSEMVNKMPDDAADNALRCAGFHVHFSFDNPEDAGFDRDNLNHYFALAKAFDMYAGRYAAQGGFLNGPRMNLYGNPGAFRPKFDYPGIEYRVLSPEVFFNIMKNEMATQVDLEKIYYNWHRFLDDGGKFVADKVALLIKKGPQMVSPSVLSVISEFSELSDFRTVA